MLNAQISPQFLPWDTEFLGFPVGRLLAAGLSPMALEIAIAAVRQTTSRLVYVMIHPTDTAAALAMQRAGAWLADRKVTFVMPLPGPHKLPPLASAISSATQYTPQLERLAWQSGEYSRFRLDPQFAPHVFQHMYSHWLRNSLNGSIARQVLVWHDHAGIESGLLTLGEKEGWADIGLLAVDAAVRGQKVGQSLVAAAVDQACNWGYQELQVVTQRDNKPACRFYEKCGFQLLREEHIYHWWLDGRDNG